MRAFQVYFRTLPYIMMAVLILAVTTVMMVFNKPDLRMRNLCAPVKLRHVNLQLALYNVCLGGVAWLVLCAMAFLFYGGRIQGTDVRLVLLILLNSICYLFVCLSVAFLLGNFVKDGGGAEYRRQLYLLGAQLPRRLLCPSGAFGRQCASGSPLHAFLLV